MSRKKTMDGALAVFEGILEAISRQRLPPGKKLPEEGLAQIFGVSRAQVRTALGRLKIRGLVQMEPNRSAQIAEPSVDEVVALFNVRKWIEPELAAEIAETVTGDQIKSLTAHLDREQAARDSGDRIEATRLSGLFHTELAALSRNAIARQYIGELVDRSFLAIYLYQRVGEVMCVNEDHFDLLAALQARDHARMRTSMRDHLDHILNRLDLERQADAMDDLAEAFRGLPSLGGHITHSKV